MLSLYTAVVWAMNAALFAKDKYKSVDRSYEAVLLILF